MGTLFSRPSHDADTLLLEIFPAGNESSVNSSTVRPYLGINTGAYDGIDIGNLPPIPLEWIVSPTHISGSCPNGTQIATWFAVTEAIITVIAVLVAYRPFVHISSRGYLGNRIKDSVWLTWTIPFVSQLLANAIIAGVVGNTDGYTSLNKLHIFNVYMARPQFVFVLIAVLRCVVTVKRPRAFAKTTIVKHKTDDRIEFPYTDAWITIAVAEIFIFIVSAIFTGVTWHRLPSQSKPREFISDHVSFISSIPGLMFLAMLTFVPVYRRYGEAFPLEGRRYETGRYWGARLKRDGQVSVGVKKQQRVTFFKRAGCALVGGVILGYICLAQWAYWTRFLQMTGVL